MIRGASVGLALLLAGCGATQESSDAAMAQMQNCLFWCVIGLAIENQSENVTETINAGEDTDIELGDIEAGQQGGNQDQANEGPALTIPTF